MNHAITGELYAMAQEMRLAYDRSVHNDPQPNGALLIWAGRLEQLADQGPEQPTAIRQILEKLREQRP